MLLCSGFLGGFILSSNFVARAETNAWWAWPGTEFYVYKHGWYTCSVGFPAWDRYGNRYFITAGHCFRSEDEKTHYFHDVGKNQTLEVYDYTNLPPVGWELHFFYPEKDGSFFDISLVQMYDGRGLHGSGWEHIPDTPIKNPRIGDAACLVGYRQDNANCGTIQQEGVVDKAESAAYFKEDLIATNYCSHPGDSGGAVYNNAGALGINVMGYADRNEPGTLGECRSEFVPIDQVLDRLRNWIPSLQI